MTTKAKRVDKAKTVVENAVERVKKGEGAKAKTKKYSDDAKALVKRSIAIHDSARPKDSKSRGWTIGPVQIERTRKALNGRTPAEATGLSAAQLRKFGSTGDLPKEKRTALMELGASIPDLFCRSRGLASQLAAIAESEAHAKAVGS
jgi:hypothetical protein